jgi:UDP-N-acetylmuramoyl-tripeptide--D-alanyl-D-alanine ligase
MHWCVSELEQAVGGQLHWPSMPPCDHEQSLVQRIVVDSRQVQRGDVLWALPGRRHHGAEFAQEAFLRGAKGVVSDRTVEPWPGCFSLSVPDANVALWHFAGWHREHFAGSVVAVTGSTGKTTTREMIHRVLGRQLKGTASQKNFNNHVGVPLSLLNVALSDHYTVLELAASAAGEIDALTRLCQPQIGVITCAGDAHLGGFGSRQAIVEAKAELLAAMPAGGCAVLPGDDARLRLLAEAHGLDVTWFGRAADCDVSASHVSYRDGVLRFRACGHEFRVPVWGRHHLDAALAAIAVGMLFGLPVTEIAAALAAFEAVPLRCEVLQLGGLTVINDSYNASPSATKAALALLREFANSGRRIALLGDMLELGDEAERLHVELGRDVVTRCGADRLIACGRHAERVADGARQAGMPPEHVEAFGDPMQSIERLERLIEGGDVLLVKGSRALEMERIVAALSGGQRPVVSDQRQTIQVYSSAS